MNKPFSSMAYKMFESSSDPNKRWRPSVWLISALSIVAVLVIVTLVSVWNYFDIGLPASPPTSDLTSDSHFINTNNFVPKGKIAWEFGAGDPVTVSPVIVDNTAYVVTGRSLQTARLSALEMDSGDPLWTMPLESIGDYPVSIAGDYLYIGTRGGKLLALDRHTGSEIWNFDTGEAVLGQPQVRDGVVYIAAGRVYAIDAASGDLRWSHELDGNASRPIAYSQGIAAAVGSSGDLSLIDAQNGKRRLTFRLWFGPSSGPVMTGGTVAIAGSGGNVQALALKAKDIPMEKAIRFWWTKLWLWQMAPRPPLPQGFLWQQRGIGNVSAHPLAFDDNRIYLGAVDDATKGRIMALDKDTGQVLWQFLSESTIADKATFAGDILIVGNKGGTLYGLDTSTGDTVWQVYVGSPISTAPAVSDTHILIPTLGGSLIALQG